MSFIDYRGPCWGCSTRSDIAHPWSHCRTSTKCSRRYPWSASVWAYLALCNPPQRSYRSYWSLPGSPRCILGSSVSSYDSCFDWRASFVHLSALCGLEEWRRTLFSIWPCRRSLRLWTWVQLLRFRPWFLSFCGMCDCFTWSSSLPCPTIIRHISRRIANFYFRLCCRLCLYLGFCLDFCSCFYEIPSLKIHCRRLNSCCGTF